MWHYLQIVYLLVILTLLYHIESMFRKKILNKMDICLVVLLMERNS